MGTRCLFQFQKWKTSSSVTVTTDSAHYHQHQHRTHQRCRRLHKGSSTMLQFFAIFAIAMSLLISHCLGQRTWGNGLEDGDRRMSRDRTRGGGNTGPCVPSQYLDAVRSPFQKLIPTFNSDSLTIQLKTDLRIEMSPSDSALVPFLNSYYATALRQIGAAGKSSLDDNLARSAMFLQFNTEYARFLVRIGVPLSCISYLLGVTDPQVMLQLQQLTKTLQSRYLSQRDVGSFHCLFGESMTGPEIMNGLRVSSNEVFSPTTYLQDTSRDAAACEQLILYMRDGSVMAKMPILNIESNELRLPTVSAPIRLGQTEVPYQLGRYIATGLNCLDEDGQKWNFTCKVVDWMRIEMVKQLVRTPVCLPGFGGILPFIVSVQQFSDTLQKTNLNSDFQPEDYDYSVRVLDNSRNYPDIQKISDAEKTASFVLQSPPVNARSMDESYETTTVAVKKHDHNHSSWLFTFFMLLLLFIIILLACCLLLGKGPRDCMLYLKNAGMHWKEEHRRRRGRRYRAPRYQRVEPESETTEAISEKEDTLVFSARRMEEEPPPPSPPPVTVTPTVESIPQEVPYEKPKDKCRRPIVEIHSSGKESIRLEITTDTECDESITTVNIDEEDCDEDDCQETCGISEFDCDEEDGVYDGDDNESMVMNNGFQQRGKRNFEDPSFFSFAPDMQSTAFHNSVTSTATSNATLSPREKRRIYQRYAGPNAAAIKRKH